jgi:peptidoglycan/LPS O-acetylase OafA/YrhL
LQGQQVNIYDYLVHFFVVHTFFPQFTNSIYWPLWFMGVIVQLYFLFPLFFRFSKKVNWFLLLLLALILQPYLTLYLKDLFGGGRFFSEFLFDFCFGVIIGNFLFENQKAFHSKEYLYGRVWPLFIGVALFCLILHVTISIMGP